jgi:23S rRNA pseudouridine1911/1915/1917 synthase
MSIKVEVKSNESLEAALRRFKRQCNYGGVFRLAKANTWHEKRSDKRRRERAAASGANASSARRRHGDTGNRTAGVPPHMGLFPKDRNLAVSPDRVEIPVRASDFRLRADALEIRLDAFLHHHLSWRSRTSIQRLIRDGYVRVDFAPPERTEREEPRVVRRAGRPLRHGARVVVHIPEELRIPAVETDPEGLVVLYEDEEVLAVDKPAGLAVHPSGRHLAGTLIQRIHARYGAEAGARLPIRLCHRLDRETSGLVLVGKGEAAHRAIMQQFEERRVEKEYLALVRGVPAEDSGTIELPLGPALASRIRLKMAVREDGLPSRTDWRVVERRGTRALLACRPRTGRQHQIRVHLEAIGHPIVGDKLYGADEELFLRAAKGALTAADRMALGLERQALHNHRLVWTSPATGERREARCPLAADIRAALEA